MKVKERIEKRSPKSSFERREESAPWTLADRLLPLEVDEEIDRLNQNWNAASKKNDTKVYNSGINGIGMRGRRGRDREG